MYRNVLRVLTFVLSASAFSTVAFCQHLSKADSLKQLLTQTTGKPKYDVLFGLFIEYLNKDNQLSLRYAEQSLQQATRLGDSVSAVKAGRAVGYVLGKLGRNGEGIHYLLRALRTAERNNFEEQIKYLLNNIALAYTDQAEYDKALDFHFRSLVIREAGGNKSEISITKNNIGLVYYRLKDFDKALEYYQQSVSIKRDIGDVYDLERTLINIAFCFNQLNKYDQVPAYIDEAFKICAPDCSDVILMEGHAALGNAYLMMMDFSKAMVEYKIAYENANKIKDGQYMADMLWGMAEIGFQKQEYDNALVDLKKAEILLDSTDYKEGLIRLYKSFANIYSKTNDFQNASFYQNKYIQLKDSVYSDALIRNLAHVQSDYQERENIKTIAENNENLRLKEEVIKRQKQIYYFIAALAILALAITFVLVIYSRSASKAKAELIMLNQTLEQRVAERTKSLESANNELDNFIYKTSHDIRGPLASLKGITNLALMELDDPRAKDYLLKLDNSADKLNTILTRLLIINQINQTVLSPQKINFDELINEILIFERKKGIPPTMTITHEVDSGVQLITDAGLLRIILENLIDNAIKYYTSSSRIEPFVKIKVVAVKDQVVVKVIDNGIGIQERNPQKLFQMFVRASERSDSGGIGLYLTKLATERLEAKVDFATTAEKYTQFSVYLPADLTKALAAKNTPLKA